SHGSGSKILAYWTRGAANLVTRKFDPEHFLDLAARGRATASFLVPTMIAMLVEARKARRGAAGRLRTLSYGGAPISPERLQSALEVFGPIFVQVYGSCEAPHPVLVLRKEEHVTTSATLHRLAAAGRAASRVDVEITDQGGIAAAPGEPGELRIRGQNVMLGYWENATATAE